MGNNPVLTHEPRGLAYSHASYPATAVEPFQISMYPELDQRDIGFAAIRGARKPAKLWTRKVVEYIFHDCDLTNPATIKPAPPEEFLTYTRRLDKKLVRDIVLMDVDEYTENFMARANEYGLEERMDGVYTSRKPVKCLTFSFVEYQARFYGFGLK